MKVIAINGSPRKNNNTATLLKEALEGAKSRGAETELVHLYDLEYKGCVSCFACKLKTRKSFGNCLWKDGLTPLLEKIEGADAVILGSPIYFGSVTGEVRSFLERLLFPYAYAVGNENLSNRKRSVGCIYTMNVTRKRMAEIGYVESLKTIELNLERAFSHVESLFVNDTFQFDDYSKYISYFDADWKAKVREEQFPLDRKKAFEMGIRFAETTER